MFLIRTRLSPKSHLSVAIAVFFAGVVHVYGQPSHELFTEILQQHVVDGLVNYGELCQDSRLGLYIKQIERTNPTSLPDQHSQLAFWINAYNAITLKLVCEEYPIESINDLHFGGLYLGTALKTTIWDRKVAKVNGKWLSLNDIEHKIIRRNFKDARAHFALVCASISCPPLRSQAFEAETLDEQLNEQARIFLSEPAKNLFDVESRTAHISKIFDWFSGDFGENDEQILQYLVPYLPDPVARDIRTNVGKWKVKHTKYDWGLNDLKGPRGSAATSRNDP